MVKKVEMLFKIHSTFIYLSRLKFKSLCLSIPSAAIDDILNSQYNAVLVIVNCCLSKRSHVEECERVMWRNTSYDLTSSAFICDFRNICLVLQELSLLKIKSFYKELCLFLLEYITVIITILGNAECKCS